jgi:hypothetical protein
MLRHQYDIDEVVAVLILSRDRISRFAIHARLHFFELAASLSTTMGGSLAYK